MGGEGQGSLLRSCDLHRWDAARGTMSRRVVSCGSNFEPTFCTKRQRLCGACRACSLVLSVCLGHLWRRALCRQRLAAVAENRAWSPPAPATPNPTRPSRAQRTMRRSAKSRIGLLKKPGRRSGWLRSCGDSPPPEPDCRPPPRCVDGGVALRHPAGKRGRPTTRGWSTPPVMPAAPDTAAEAATTTVAGLRLPVHCLRHTLLLRP